MLGKRGRPRALPVITAPITDEDAFWRLKAVGFNSSQCMRTLEFCVAWQRAGGSVTGMVARGDRSRATIFNRLKECHRGGFEPELVRMEPGDAEKWEFLEYTRVEQIKEVHRKHQALPRVLRLLSAPEMRPEPDDNIDLDAPADPKGLLED